VEPELSALDSRPSTLDSQGVVAALCTSDQKGTPKEPVWCAVFEREFGILGDAHAGPGPRQLSILDVKDHEYMRSKLPDIHFGAFGENLVFEGIDLSQFGVGSRFLLGEKVEISITQIGKTCHARCAIFEKTGDCIMPRAGLFARVLGNGPVWVGDTVRVLEHLTRGASGPETSLKEPLR